MVRRNNGMIAGIRVAPQKTAATLLSFVRGVMGRAPMQYRFSPSFFVLLGSVTVAFAAIAACSDDASRTCRVGADCTSGVCNTDGTCGSAADAGADSGASGTDGGRISTNLDAGPLSNDDGGGLKGVGCEPNNDGTITRDEVPIQAGLHGVFRFAENVEISTAGVTNSDGTRTWDYSNVLVGDANVLIETFPLDGTWYGPEFPGATYSTQLSKSPNLLAVFEYDEQQGSLALRGEVSTNNDQYKTDLTNDPPVEVLKFPLTKGASWTTTTNVSGTAPNPFAPTQPSIPFAYTDQYDNEVDATGTLISPLGSFNVMRVKIVLTRTFAPTTDGGSPTVIVFRQFAFVTECYGNVASISSNAYEPNEEFTNAAEIRRIAP